MKILKILISTTFLCLNPDMDKVGFLVKCDWNELVWWTWDPGLYGWNFSKEFIHLLDYRYDHIRYLNQTKDIILMLDNLRGHVVIRHIFKWHIPLSSSQSFTASHFVCIYFFFKSSSYNLFYCKHDYFQ